VNLSSLPRINNVDDENVVLLAEHASLANKVGTFSAPIVQTSFAWLIYEYKPYLF